MTQYRLYQVRYPLHQVAEWVNSSEMDDYVVSVTPLEEDMHDRRSQHDRHYNGPMAYIFLRVPVDHKWALARPPRDPIERRF